MNTMEMIMRGKRIEQVESNYISSVLGYLNVFGENINDCNLESNTVIKSFELAQGHLNMSDVQVYALYLKNFIINKQITRPALICRSCLFIIYFYLVK